MLAYPSVHSARGTAFREFKAHVFDKLDGSNLRFEWSRKRYKKDKYGWYKQGTRERLFDESDPIFGEAINEFKARHADRLTKVAIDERWQNLTVFMEYLGPSSLAGYHSPVEIEARLMRLHLFDASTDGKLLLPVKEYLKAFESIDDKAKYLGVINWTRGFVEEVWATVPRKTGGATNITFEGVVGKANDRDELVMAKAKTEDWIRVIKARFSEEEAQKIVDS